MGKTIEPKLKKIGDYLKLENNVKFVIPEYQRAYSWDVNQCDKLWQDVLEFDSDNNDRYFFGTIIISCQSDDAEFGLIDGQQRTTTFLLLLKALLEQINKAIISTSEDTESESLNRGLKERRRKIMGILYKAESEDIPDKPDDVKDYEIYKKSECIIKNCSINELYKSELEKILKSKNYENAQEIVFKIPHKRNNNKYTNFFRNFDFFYNKIRELSDSQVNNFAKSLTEKCEVIVIKSWQVEQAMTMFNSLNSDGLPLYDSDIISAKLFAYAEMNQQEMEFRTQWENLLNLLSNQSLKDVVNIDSILMQKMYYERAHHRGEIITDTGAINVTTPGLRKYFIELRRDLLEQPVVFCNHLISLVKLWDKVLNYTTIQLLIKFNNNIKYFIACYLLRFSPENITENDINDVALCLIRLFSILEISDLGYSSKFFKTFLFGECVKLADPSIPVQTIITDFDNHIQRNWNINSIQQSLNSYNKNILIYLNEFLFAKNHNIDFNLNHKCDIEHIMPSSGKNSSSIRNDAGINSDEEFEDIVNKIGNKILLEEKINRSIGNEWFRTKVSGTISNQQGYVNSIYPIAKALVNEYKNIAKPNWRKEDIERATLKATNRIAMFILGRL